MLVRAACGLRGARGIAAENPPVHLGAGRDQTQHGAAASNFYVVGMGAQAENAERTSARFTYR